MKKLFLLSCLVVLASACAHHRDVRPGAEGIHRVVVATEGTDEGSRDAIEQANHFCAQRNQTAAFIEEKSNYKGSMKESTYNNAKMASKIAGAAGGAAYVFGGSKESKAGGIIGLGGGIADEALGKGYSVDMKFKCI